MYRKCATEHSVRKQRMLENTLLELMLKMPYEDISVTRICQEAEVSRRIFYHLFGSKQGALLGLIDHRIMDLEGFRTELPDQALRFFLFWRSQSKLLDALRKNHLEAVLMERMMGNLLQEGYDVWRWLQAEDPENRQEILVFNLCGIMGLVFKWHASGYQKEAEQMAVLIAELMQKPLAKQEL